MMQAIMEAAFDIIYLTTVITLGILMVIKGKGNKQYFLFGIMALSLGFGDAFHLVPRALALCTTGLESYAFYLGLGKLITSITMTGFYLILYYVYRIRYNIKGQNYLTIAMYLLAIARIVLCALPQNDWFSGQGNLLWGIIRNIPFTIIGIIIIVVFYLEAKKNNDKDFKFMWLTIVLSFGFYIPVVLLADQYPLIGLLMMPKTIAYVWTVVIGYKALIKDLKQRG